MSEQSTAKNGTRPNDVISLVKEYARQETLGPLKGVGRWMGFGLAGAFALGLGLFFVLLGVLRLLQTETGSAFKGNYSVVPYAIVLVLCVLIIVVVVTRIRKDTLHRKEPRK